MRRDILAIATISATAIGIILILLILSGVKNPPADIVYIQNHFALPMKDFAPEPRERLQFIVSVLLFPIICVSFFSIFKNQVGKFRGNLLKIYLPLSITIIIFLIWLTLAGEKNTNNNYLGSSSLQKAPLLTTVFSTALLIESFILQKPKAGKSLSRNWLSAFLYFSTGACLIMLLAMETVFGETDVYASQFHFIAYFDSVAQTYLGKTLLVDNNAQYGLYSIILKPIFSIIGLSVFKFTLVMSLIKGLAYLSLLALLWNISKNKLMAFLGFTTLIFFSRMRIPMDINTDPYFQYWPHRQIFPYFIVYMLWLYTGESNNGRKKALYYFISMLCALAILWNLDTGLVVLISWIFALFYMEFLSLKLYSLSKIATKCISHLGVTIGALFIAISGLYIYTYMVSSKLPDLSALLIYPTLFYNYGFYLLPITNAIHLWNLVALIYVAGFFASVRHMIELNAFNQQTNLFDKKTRIHIITFTLSIMGIGLFNYYVSRSHDYNLLSPSWPLIPLLVVFSDQTFSELNKIVHRKSLDLITKIYLFTRRIHKVFLLSVIFTIFSSSILSISYYLPSYFKFIDTRTTSAKAGIPEFLAGEIKFIKANTNKGDKVLILSNYAPELYLYINTPRPLPVPGFGNDLVLKSDMDKIMGFLIEPPPNAKIFWDPTFTVVVPSQFKHLLATDIYGKNLLILYEKK